MDFRLKMRSVYFLNSRLLNSSRLLRLLLLPVLQSVQSGPQLTQFIVHHRLRYSCVFQVVHPTCKLLQPIHNPVRVKVRLEVGRDCWGVFSFLQVIFVFSRVAVGFVTVGFGVVQGSYLILNLLNSTQSKVQDILQFIDRRRALIFLSKVLLSPRLISCLTITSL